MTQKYEIKKKIIDYVKRNNLNYKLINDNDKPTDINSLDTMYLRFDNFENVLGRYIEGDIHLNKESMFIRVYYNKGVSDIVGESNYNAKLSLLEIINFINAECFFTNLYSSRMYLTQDGFNDIAIQTSIPYYFYELVPAETMEYITVFLPTFLEQFCIPIIKCLSGHMTSMEAIKYIRRECLNEEY